MVDTLQWGKCDKKGSGNRHHPAHSATYTYILTVITASVLQQMPFRFVYYNIPVTKTRGKLLNDVPKNNVSTTNLVTITILTLPIINS